MQDFKAAIVPVTGFQQNCTILWDAGTKRGVVIDPGGEVPRILGALGKLGVAVDTIVLTHGHLDHACGAAELKETLEAQQGGSVPLEGPDERDKFLLDNLKVQGEAFGIADARNCTPDRFLHEGETITLAGVEFDILHCPGHTPGSLVYVSQALRFALVGDVLFRGSIGRTDFPYGDTEALLASIREKLLPLGDDISFICGHGPGSTFGAERASNPFLTGAVA
jgi:hydroxyacylglutathione hydrolase